MQWGNCDDHDAACSMRVAHDMPKGCGERERVGLARDLRTKPWLDAKNTPDMQMHSPQHIYRFCSIRVALDARLSLCKG